MTTTTKPNLDCAIEWPNGQGFTECSQEFADIDYQIDVMNDEGRISMEDMSREDYEIFNQLLDRRNTLHNTGHLGKSHRY